MVVLSYDHGAYEIFQGIKKYLRDKNIEYKEYASEELDVLDSAATFALKANNEIKTGCMGIYGCTTGIAMSMASNRTQGVRGALCFNNDIAKMSRQHNDANVCIIPCKYLTLEQTIEIIDIFMSTEFLGGKYLGRVQELDS